MGKSPKIPEPSPAPPPPPTPATQARAPKSASPTLGGTFLTASMPGAAPMTKPKPGLKATFGGS